MWRASRSLVVPKANQNTIYSAIHCSHNKIVRFVAICKSHFGGYLVDILRLNNEQILISIALACFSQ